ncbi:glycosyl hydrolase [Aquibacillus albus]|uniref:Glycosyl hydrolases family 2 sugar binding domain-containing protein n=1 Tax=Aquibacillus albus TaxID=1168171 RepID=A0ABS2N5T1_9BACI|nr:glycosyl hydrolase [Aquibacillus albus]MBM7573468.1 hypothetical protein [Aquibacillus albus]
MSDALQQQFLDPPEEFTPIPFWFWNDDLTKEEIARQIHDFHEKGVTGFVLHPRIGIPEEIEYLSETFMNLVHVAVEEAKCLGMSVILYDEAMYPSGAAKGFVVKDNPEYASRGLMMIEYPCQKHNEMSIDLSEGEKLVSVQAVEKLTEASIDLASCQLLQVESEKVHFTPPNNGNWSLLLFIETFSGGTIRGIHFGEDDGEEHAPASADLLNPDAVKKFIQITHDTYYAKLKEYFGDTVIAMFTDEPDILGRGSAKGLKPWTNDFLTYFKGNGNEEIDLPALWFDAGDQTDGIRKNYRKAVNKRLTEVYYKQISDWCAGHGIALTGHPAASDDIGLLEHFQIPGQDVVWRWVAPEDGKALEGEHSTAGKCSADAARHRGRRRNLNEFLGVCSKESPWALSAGDMKWYMDWLLVRGVNLLCPHAFYYSIDGKRRSHERPPDVGPNNLWWPYYKQFSQYMKRLSWLMTDSNNQTSVAVLCEEDHLPWKIVKPFYENQVEFNYLEQSLLLSSSNVQDGRILIVDQSYEVIVVEDYSLIDDAVQEKLELFNAGGGHVIVCTESSHSPVDRARTIRKEEEVVSALPDISKHQVTLRPHSPSIRLSKVVKDGTLFYFFVNEGEDNYVGTFEVEEGKVEKWDPWNGAISEVAVQQDRDKRFVPFELERRSSIVFSVDTNQAPKNADKWAEPMNITFIPMNDGWAVKNSPTQAASNALESWVEWDGMEAFSGTVTYENSFAIEEESPIAHATVDLGEVYEIARLTVNGKEVGLKMWAPYRFELDPSFLQAGKNTISIDVTNSMANKMDNARLKSGLIGPVSMEIRIID